VTPQDFRDAFPAFKTVKDGPIQAQITASDEYFDPARWGVPVDFYRGNWIAHMLVLGNVDGAPGVGGINAMDANDVTSRDTETIKISRSERLVFQQSADHFYRTTWGQIYVNKARQIGMGGAAV
jgi:hypothetical protein